MAGFTYFVPGLRSRPDREELAKLPIAGVLDDLDFDDSRLDGNGPGGKSGMILAPHYPLVKTRENLYHPDQQTWQECDGGSFWLGWRNGELPGPDILERPMPFGRYAPILGDGNHWRIPVARVTGEFPNDLPCVYRLDATGKRLRVPPPKYGKLLEFATTTFDGIVNQFRDADDPLRVDVLVSEDFNWQACIAALNANYRVTEWEVSALGLLTTQNMGLILQAFSGYWDYLVVREALDDPQKKTATAVTSDISSTSGGAAA